MVWIVGMRQAVVNMFMNTHVLLNVGNFLTSFSRRTIKYGGKQSGYGLDDQRIVV